MTNFDMSISATQAGQVHHQVRADILNGRLVPGSRIRMGEIAEKLSVSLGADREGLSRLAAEHIVVAAAQSGYTVATVSIEDLNDLTNTRIALEQICLRAAIENGSLEWEAALMASLHRLQRLSEVEPSDHSRINEQWSKAHGAFHQALVAGCSSNWMHKLRASLYVQTERYRQLSVPLRTVERDVAGEHRALCEAALSREADRACELISEHLIKTTEILLHSPLLAPAKQIERAVE
jgi:GntR family carbon starvation induced transcriptional regulator